ncbi:Rab family GTPase [Thermodesulfobacteriota bacterium]
MIQKKICMMGSFAVGKTSLVRRFVKSIFNEKYLTTVGVKIDKKSIKVGDQDVMLMVWDLEGQDNYHTVRTSYLRGASGYFIVVDGTNRGTLEVAMKLRDSVGERIGEIPHLLLVNKMDLMDSWELGEEDLSPLAESGLIIRQTSAKTGEGVEEAFLALAEQMLESRSVAKSAR